MHRGARREAIFRRDEHCLLFLRSVEEAVEHHGLEVHGYSLMPNHYHLLVRSPLGNLSRCMKHVDGTYTQRLNLRYGWDGPVFRGRFRSQMIEEERYLDHVFAYIHLNPFRARLARRLDEPCWTSLRAYLGRERAPGWLTTGFFGDRLGGSRGIEEAVRVRRKSTAGWLTELDEETGWIRPPDGESPRAVSEGRGRIGTARATVEDVLKRVALETGCDVRDLQRPEMGAGANPRRRLAVWALSRTLGSPHREIARALRMSEGAVANVLWRLRRETPRGPLLYWMEAVSEWSKAGSGRV